MVTRWKNKEELTSTRMNKMLDEIEASNNQDAPKVITPILLQVNSEWTEQTVKGTYAKDDERGVLYLAGHYKKNSNISADDILATLPEGYRPKKQQILMVVVKKNTIYGTGIVLITTTGDIKVLGSVPLNEIVFSGSILLN
ncbi:hypothetical protein [Filifactor alocis]